MLNPKAALFFLSVLPQFVHGEGSPARQIFLLGALDVLIGVAYWFALVAVAARLRAFLARPAVHRRWELTPAGCSSRSASASPSPPEPTRCLSPLPLR
ncbi:LysE family transporter [Streptomyces sp. NPDC002734]|uniref:LysE family translocator n=1 Tax=Streptomyces sp. NPDC002734 TaxID=3154426 RepID=UPI00332F195A